MIDRPETRVYRRDGEDVLDPLAEAVFWLDCPRPSNSYWLGTRIPLALLPRSAPKKAGGFVFSCFRALDFVEALSWDFDAAGVSVFFQEWLPTWKLAGFRRRDGLTGFWWVRKDLSGLSAEGVKKLYMIPAEKFEGLI